ncbi:ent-kaurene oxidase [Fusarium napiforme]|uniref:Ent-kaurene oxidase n=1 Tax=Fusarium napiforme TaxID=42672 RepID=A0A8H5IZS5_9HYPO|nr:ent-kaurene oxidase [Fusarium napiforme]
MRSDTKSACLALVFLGLMTLADSITDSLLPALADDAHTQSGHWNLGTAALVLKGVSDIVGQFVIGYVLNIRSKHHAMNLNATSILVASLVTLLSLCYEQQWPILVAVVGPLVRCIGGGSHASAFLILSILHDQAPTHYRFASYYCTGAVSVVAQSLGPFFASKLADSSHLLPGILSGTCCLIGFGIVDSIKSAPCESNNSSHDESTSLLPNHQHDVEPKSLDISVTEYLSRCFGKRSLIKTSSLIFLPQVFFLMAICKSTRPLFKAYIQHRDDVSPAEAEALWLLRSVMSVVIFGIILPCVVLHTAPSVTYPNSINLHAARIGVLFISIGAFMIGLSGSLRSITAALVINTLGVATDLSLLAFASCGFSSSDAGTVMMTLASIESAGTLLGIGVLYPIYQWSINEGLPFLVGGVPYYICGSLYAVTALRTGQQSFLMSSYLDLLLGNPQYAIFCGVTLLTLFLIRYSLLGHVTKFPLLNPKKSLELTSNRVTQDFIVDSKNILANGRALYKDQPYRAYTDWGKVVVIPPKFLDALKSHKQLDFGIPAEDDSHAYVPGFDPFASDPHISKVVTKYLTKSLTKLTAPLSGEASLAFRQVLTDSTVRIVSRMSSRVFMGEALCRDEEWVKASGDYTVQAFKAGDILRTYPRWSRPFVHWFLPSCWTLRKKLDEAIQCLKPHLEHRSVISKEAEEQGKPSPFDDSIEWYKKEGSTRNLALLQISLSLVAIHTTSDLLMETLFNIAQHPELFQALREEITDVLSIEGLKKTALYNLKLMDSVIKESQRLRPALLGFFRRQAMADITLPNGDVIRKGEKIVCDATHMWNRDYYEEAAKFDGYRFLRMREASEQDKHPHLVSTSFDHLGFGHGNHACPGRFFAANEIKIALCHMLLKYDWKLADGVIPKPSGFGMMYLPDLQAKLLIRRRNEELDIDTIET